jgi:hypothetical protein
MEVARSRSSDADEKSGSGRTQRLRFLHEAWTVANGRKGSGDQVFALGNFPFQWRAKLSSEVNVVLRILSI